MKAIETIYKGYRFRSRLEARWAVFFDALGIEWQYESEGFEASNGARYLPDFKLARPDGVRLPIWFEVKGSPASPHDLAKAEGLARAAVGVVVVVEGEPLRATTIEFLGDRPPKKCRFDATGPEGVSVLLALRVLGSEFDVTRCDSSEALAARVIEAGTAARQARFEHGQVGAPSDWGRAA